MAVDSFADLIPVAVVLGYLFLKFAGRSARPEAPPPPRPAARPAGLTTAGPTPFEQLLARLEEANNETRGITPAPPPAPPPARLTSRTVVPAAKREFSRASRLESMRIAENRKAVADYEARTAAATAFRTYDDGHGFDAETSGFDAETQGFAHERHGFGPQNPLSEPAFQAGRTASRRVSRQAYDPHALTPSPTPAPGPGIAARLREPGALRDAFVLQTILARRPTPRRPGAAGGAAPPR